MCNDFSININNSDYNVDIGQEQDFTIEIEQAPEVVINLNEQGPMGPQGQPGQQGETGNGIETIRQTGTSGLEDTYTIYYTNGDTQDYTVTNGEKGDDGFSPLATITSTATGATITITDAEGTTTADITNGIDGQDGDAATIEVGTVTTGAAGTSATVVNSGTSSAAVFDFTIPRGDKGETGETGNGISSITQTGTSGLVDTYTIYYTNGNDTTFDVTNGQDGTDGYSPTATVTQSDNITTITITDKNGTTTESIDLSGIISDIEDIQELIPSQATSSNQLADKDFVNSSIATNTANFIGTFANVPALIAYSGTVTNNDYAFVVNSVIKDNGNDWATFAALDAYDKDLVTNFDYAWVINGTKFDLYRFDILTQTWGLRVQNTDKSAVTLNTAYNRYKAVVENSTVSWEWEYTLNNSSFTASQWAAINSGITSNDVTLIGTALQPNDNVSELNNDAGYTTNVGTVTSVNNTQPDANGNVTISTASAISDLTDVQLTNLTDGQTLVYDSNSSKWVNGNGGVSASYDSATKTITFS